MILYSFSLHRIIRLAVAYGHCLRFLSNDENLRDEIHAHFKFETCALPIIHLLRERWLMRRQRRSISITSPFCTVQYSTLINQSINQCAVPKRLLYVIGRRLRARSCCLDWGRCGAFARSQEVPYLVRFGSVRFGSDAHGIGTRGATLRRCSEAAAERQGHENEAVRRRDKWSASAGRVE